MNTETAQKLVETPPPRVLLGVSGGIAAYKAAQLVRLLTAAGAQVQVVLTDAAARFVTAQTFQALSGRAVRHSLWDEQAEAAMGHIELARWADLLIVAPATANTLARLRLGMADDLLTTLCLAASAPLYLAPAMNQAMWRHAATQDNLAMLIQRGARVIGPDHGDQACGDAGPGRMAEPEQICATVMQALARQPVAAEIAPLHGCHVVITAGPTYEDIDPVRFIGNRSSGRMGYALAAAAQELGAQVILVSGPVSLPPPARVQVVPVRSAVAMEQAVMHHMPRCDIFIAAAAVADYRVAEPAAQKLKKHDLDEPATGGDRQIGGLQLQLVPNPDILANVARREAAPFCVGFAAETENLRDNARAKLERKGIQMIAANRVDDGRGFDRDDNALLVLDESGEQQLPLSDKALLARQLLALVAKRFNQWRARQSASA